MRVDMLLGSPPSIKHLIPHEYNSLLLEGVKKGGDVRLCKICF